MFGQRGHYERYRGDTSRPTRFIPDIDCGQDSLPTLPAKGRVEALAERRRREYRMPDWMTYRYGFGEDYSNKPFDLSHVPLIPRLIFMWRNRGWRRRLNQR